MKIVHFTHTDLDGVTCAKLIKETNHKDDIYIPWFAPTPKHLDKAIEEFDFTDIDLIIITDLTPSLKVFDKIKRYASIVLIDHHDTDWVQKLVIDGLYQCGFNNKQLRKNTCVSIRHSNKLSASWMTYEMTRGKTIPRDTEDITDPHLYGLANLADIYDMWRLDHPLRKTAEKLNRRFWFIGRDRFMNTCIDDLNNMQWLDEILLEQEENYVKAAIKKGYGTQLKLFLDKTHDVYLVSAEKCMSQIGDSLTPDWEIIAIINFGTGSISLRSDGNVNVTEIAKHYGGGGHKKGTTAGFPITKKSRIFVDAYINIKLKLGDY